MDGLISRPGRVRRIVAGQALVAVVAGGCSSCKHAAGCGIGRLAGERGETLLALPALPGLAVGDAVNVELREAQLTRAALFGYLLPVLLIVAGALLGQSVGEKVGTGNTVEGLAALGALVGLALGLLLTRLYRPPSPRLVSTAASLSIFPLEKPHV
ncbi:MAG: SoxR reducing system RseC family protein [Pseudomonadota bacterium]|jgi:sigma-E factor negative regulatory protein RseC